MNKSPDLTTGAIAHDLPLAIGFGFGTNETSLHQKPPKAIVSFLYPIGITQSQFEILRMARCELETKAIPRHPQHHNLVHEEGRTQEPQIICSLGLFQLPDK